MTKNKDDKKIIIKLIMHHVILVLMVIIMVFAVAYAYYAMQGQEAGVKPAKTNSKGAAHPLPEFIIDKIKPNELGDLKP